MFANLVKASMPRRSRGHRYRSQGRKWESLPRSNSQALEAPSLPAYKPTVKTAAFAPTAVVGGGGAIGLVQFLFFCMKGQQIATAALRYHFWAQTFLYFLFLFLFILLD